ncbi:methyl-accepting chemotaxis protein [Clostridium ganghwense]|uniref:Methyl-accepting chemotaxis protein n=1 Tax=Clostridium ganghwense TaxID=312089 RepID=A0ABT4CKB2_9CLOT|nr:methyl-accepting chemotaxis protein [Clostridium ganghwense]MCY6369486.1 methyl-accepting chemotaxis protein [Clostridium ganghwense]
MRLNIKQKLTMSFVLIITIMLIVSGTLLYELFSIDKDYKVIVNKNVPVEKYVEEIRAINLEQVAAVRAYILYDDEKFPPLFEELNGKSEDIYMNIEKNIETDVSKKHLVKIKEIHAEYSKIAKDVFALVKSNNVEAAVKRAFDGREHVRQIKVATEEWLEFVESYDQGIISNINHSISRTIKINIIILIFILLFVIILVLYFIRDICNPLSELVTHANSISNSDLSCEISEKLLKRKDELGELTTAFDKMSKNLCKLVGNIIKSSEEVAESSALLMDNSKKTVVVSQEIGKSIDGIALGASNQASSTEEGSLKIDELGNIVESSQECLKELNVSSDKVMLLINEGMDIIKLLMEKTNRVNEASRKVYSEIIKTNESSECISQASSVISSIAEQTNLLALNAAIEAARAGEHGKGFAVVAEEIRKLAEQSAESTREIDTVVKELQDNSREAVETMKEVEIISKEQDVSVKHTEEKYKGVAEAMSNSYEFIRKTSNLGEEIANMKNNLLSIVQNLAAIAEENAASTEEVAASTEEQTTSIDSILEASENLSKLAEKLQNEVIKFKIV